MLCGVPAPIRLSACACRTSSLVMAGSAASPVRQSSTARLHPPPRVLAYSCVSLQLC